jgi:AraC-like DNA-binding protein
MRFVFSTDTLEPAGRFEAFRDALARGLFKFDLITRNNEPYRGVVDLFVGGPVVFGQVLGSSAELARSPALARQCDEGVWVLLTRSGRMRIEQGDIQSEVLPGQGIIVNSTRPHTGACLGESDTWVVQVPEVLLRNLRPRGAANATTFLPHDSAITQMMLSMLETYSRLGASAPSGLGAATAQYLADLVAIALGTNADGAAIVRDRGLGAGRLQLILDDIARHFLDADIVAADVAKRVGITPRYVHFLLEQTGRTFSDHVLAHRLALSRRLLTNGASDRRKIADIAYACGFNDLSYFNRTFRQRYGETPSDARAGGVAPQDS